MRKQSVITILLACIATMILYIISRMITDTFDMALITLIVVFVTRTVQTYITNKINRR